ATLLLVFLSVSWASGFGQHAPKFTTPQIVATFQLLDQTGEVHPTTIYTPKNWGTFRISIVLVGTVANGADGRLFGGVQYTDGSGINFFGTSLQTQSQATVTVEFPIRAKAGTPLKFTVKPSGDIFGSKYNVWVVVEQLM